MHHHVTTRCFSFATHVPHKNTAPCKSSAASVVASTEHPQSKQGYNEYTVASLFHGQS